MTTKPSFWLEGGQESKGVEPYLTEFMPVSSSQQLVSILRAFQCYLHVRYPLAITLNAKQVGSSLLLSTDTVLNYVVSGVLTKPSDKPGGWKITFAVIMMGHVLSSRAELH